MRDLAEASNFVELVTLDYGTSSEDQLPAIDDGQTELVGPMVSFVIKSPDGARTRRYNIGELDYQMTLLQAQLTKTAHDKRFH